MNDTENSTDWGNLLIKQWREEEVESLVPNLTIPARPYTPGSGKADYHSSEQRLDLSEGSQSSEYQT